MENAVMTTGPFRVVRWLVAALMIVLAALPLSGDALAQGSPSLDVVSPQDGATITANDIPVQVKVSDLKLDCAALGRPDENGVGQVLALIDGTTIAQLANFYCTDTFTISGEGLAPGKHTLTFVLASNTHAPMMDTAKQVMVDFQPPQPAPLPAANYTGDPGVTLSSPHDGDTVPTSFPVQITPVNFSPTAALEGKTNVPGYGHYHVWVDAPEKPASLANLVLMPGTNAFTLDLSAWGPGKHTIRIEPAQNDHTMYDPAQPATFTVTVSDTATPTAMASPAASPAAAAASAPTVNMTDELRFVPADLTIKVGDTVTWVNASAIQHTSTDDPAQNPVASAHPEYAQLPSGAEPWNSGLLQPGQSFAQEFTVPGTYHYFCIPHVLSGMRGTITVQS
ncbi:MAG TPA: plastocyanin/azurin family copper-binding protein [Thermomicrobiales bacterium]|nr:plastocyanin/azurin family copper-binding protein [Thermomicrobiales bacterium]